MQFTLLIIGVLALLPAAFCAVITSGHADISAIGAIVTSGHADISARQSGVAGWPGPTDYDVIGCFYSASCQTAKNLYDHANELFLLTEPAMNTQLCLGDGSQPQTWGNALLACISCVMEFPNTVPADLLDEFVNKTTTLVRGICLDCGTDETADEMAISLDYAAASAGFPIVLPNITLVSN